MRKAPHSGFESRAPHHDYSLTWVYAVGEVDAPSPSDCKKALAFVEAESECIGAACKYGKNLVSDYLFACRKIGPAAQRVRMQELAATLEARVTQATTDCVQQIDDWLSRGCGAEGACEPQIQQWATRCAAETKSPLGLHLLQRLVENSFQESRPVKLDVRSCVDLSKQLEAAAQCNRPFDCEDAMPQADLYLNRCAQGQPKALPLPQAAQIAHIRLVAGKPVTSMALSDAKQKMVSLPGMLVLAEGTGAVVRVCGETLTDLVGYLSQRKACQDGELELLSVLRNAEGASLQLKKHWHESDVSFYAAHPTLLVDGEANARGQKAIEEFAAAFGALPQRAAEDFTNAFEQANEAFAAVVPNQRQSPKLHQALAVHDSALSVMFGLIGEQKGDVASKRLGNRDLAALAHRAKKFVFSDITRQGSIEVGKSSELSELALERVLPKAFAAYKRNLKKLDSLVAERRIKRSNNPPGEGERLAAYTDACSAARDRVNAAREKLAHCSDSADACSTEERNRCIMKLQSARAEFSSARVNEILAKASLGQKDEPSDACKSW